MRISDWSSDVRSSDLKVGDIEAISIGFVLLMTYRTSLMLTPADAHTFLVAAIAGLLTFIGVEIVNHILEAPVDRKSVVSGKSVSVRVDIGGRRIIKNKKTKNTLTHKYTT